MRHWVCIYLVLLGLFAASASTFSCPNADVSFGLEPDTYICPTHATGGYEYQWLQPKSVTLETVFHPVSVEITVFGKTYAAAPLKHSQFIQGARRHSCHRLSTVSVVDLPVSIRCVLFAGKLSPTSLWYHCREGHVSVVFRPYRLRRCLSMSGDQSQSQCDSATDTDPQALGDPTEVVGLARFPLVDLTNCSRYIKTTVDVQTRHMSDLAPQAVGTETGAADKDSKTRHQGKGSDPKAKGKDSKPPKAAAARPKAEDTTDPQGSEDRLPVNMGLHLICHDPSSVAEQTALNPSSVASFSYAGTAATLRMAVATALPQSPPVPDSDGASSPQEQSGPQGRDRGGEAGETPDTESTQRETLFERAYLIMCQSDRTALTDILAHVAHTNCEVISSFLAAEQREREMSVPAKAGKESARAKSSSRPGTRGDRPPTGQGHARDREADNGDKEAGQEGDMGMGRVELDAVFSMSSGSVLSKLVRLGSHTLLDHLPDSGKQRADRYPGGVTGWRIVTAGMCVLYLEAPRGQLDMFLPSSRSLVREKGMRCFPRVLHSSEILYRSRLCPGQPLSLGELSLDLDALSTSKETWTSQRGAGRLSQQSLTRLQTLLSPGHSRLDIQSLKQVDELGLYLDDAAVGALLPFQLALPKDQRVSFLFQDEGAPAIVAGFNLNTLGGIDEGGVIEQPPKTARTRVFGDASPRPGQIVQLLTELYPNTNANQTYRTTSRTKRERDDTERGSERERETKRDREREQAELESLHRTNYLNTVPFSFGYTDPDASLTEPFLPRPAKLT
ncbi:hypothetical protein KIPB_005567, partial [Kipferlia bialata]|eukprot:g5567.t1